MIGDFALTSAVEDYRLAAQAALGLIPVDVVAALTRLIFETTLAGGVVYVFGNGGSAATAMHMACDLGKNTRVPGAPALRCVCLADGLPMLTALGNDEGYDQVFAAPLRALGRPGDLALAISGSGNSPNVLRGLIAAEECGLRRAALLGFAGGKARSLVDLAVVVESESMACIEDAHLVINHMLTTCLQRMFAAIQGMEQLELAMRLVGQPQRVRLIAQVRREGRGL